MNGSGAASPEEALRRDFLFFSGMCEGKSPLYAALSRSVADDPEVLRLAGPPRRGQPPVNLLFGSVHYLLLAGRRHALAAYYPSVGGTRPVDEDAYPAFRDFCLTHAADIVPLAGTRRVQTNEVGRCGALLPAFHRAWECGGGRPLTLIELGASLGLNLGFDRYRYVYSTGATCGDPGAPVVRTESRGAVAIPIPSRFPEVAGRVGVDIEPGDPADPDAVRWIEALVWPDQTHRLALFRGAVEAARRAPVRMVRGDGLETLPALVEGAVPGSLVVVFHSHAVYQMDRAWRNAFAERLAAWGRTRDLVHVSLEWLDDHPGPRLDLTLFTRGEARSEHLASCDHHGAWVAWSAADPPGA